MARLSENIHVISDFQYSINLEYDLYSDQKIKNYIPTSSAIDIIEDVMLSTSPKATDRSRIFVGAYGKGKSHLALMLLALLSRKDETLYTDLLNMICQTKPELCRFILEYQRSNQRMLPVVIQGSRVGIRQAFLMGIRRALQVAGIGNIMPSTYFNAAITSINKWKESFPETYERFKNLIPCTVTEFISELSDYNNEFYDVFVKIYPKLTSGSEFNPIDGMDIVELYNDVNAKIREHGYTGIFVVYDEFSKFLLGNLKNTSVDEIEVLQYFAENCNRSGEKQMHILLISHQSILNYVDKLPKNKINSWRAVSQRYKSIELNTSQAQMYDLTSRVISYNEEWYDTFINNTNNRTVLGNVWRNWKDKRLFSELTDNEFQRVVYRCYPLHPVTTFILPKISEQIAQNERTLFTFLSATGQRFTLTSFLEKTEDECVTFLTPDYIFDYFEGLFKADGYDRITHKYWKIATSAIAKLTADQYLEAKIIKTIALIYILDRFELLPPTVATLMNIFRSEAMSVALTNLTNAGIIRKLENKDYLKLTEYVGYNVETLIIDKMNERARFVNIESILNQFSGSKVLYPNIYNDDNEIVRYFNFKFITADKIINNFDFKQALPENEGDGVVFAVIANSDQYDSIIEIISAIDERRIVFIVLNEQNDVLNLVQRYDAIKTLYNSTIDDILKEELDYSIVAMEELLNSFVDSFLRPELGLAKYYVGGQEKNIKRRSTLSRVLSEICESHFYRCPTINNEVLNKNKLSSQAISSRNKLISGILSNELESNLGLSGNGQEISFMKSTLYSTGIITENEVGATFTLDVVDVKLKNILAIIKDFIVNTSSTGKTSIGKLFDYLSNAENHIGMKRGLIPVYFAVVLHFYKKHCVILKGNKELEINAKLLDLISEDPGAYDIYLEDWDKTKERYVSDLECTFKDFVLSGEKEFNNFNFVAKAMQRWYLQLPKYVKEIKNIYLGDGQSELCDIQSVRLINSLRMPEINARDYLFNKLAWVYEKDGFCADISSYVAQSKKIIDNIKPNLINTLKKDLARMFAHGRYNINSTLTSLVIDWTTSLREEVFSHMFNGNENALLDICKRVTPDENNFIETLARLATGLRIDDWAEITVESFISTIKNFILIVEEFNLKVASDSNHSAKSYKISFIDENGIESYRTFDSAEYSAIGKLMYNDAEAMIAEYGESLSQNEKRQVLIDVINKLLS